MSKAASRAAIEQRLLTMWTADSVTLRTPIAFDNAAGLVELVGGQSTLEKPPKDAAWIRLTIREGQGRQVDINSNARIRAEGLIVVQVFIPVGGGANQADELADLLKPIFERKQFSGVNCRARGVETIGQQGTDRWWQVNVTFPFYRDELSSP